MPDYPVNKSDEQWKQQLSDEQFRVVRQKGTERAFTGTYWDEKRDGMYACVCCGEPLYTSKAKFDSGTGWPSFCEAAGPDAVTTETDGSHLMVRTEALCANCGAHLGHVFDDGPNPTGMRHCINSASLKFNPADEGD